MQVIFLVYVFQKNDNPGHLSPEEWECLMFLEKTIESLEAEENIELSINNADCLPFVAGSLAAKKAQVPSLVVGTKLEGEWYPVVILLQSVFWE